MQVLIPLKGPDVVSFDRVGSVALLGMQHPQLRLKCRRHTVASHGDVAISGTTAHYRVTNLSTSSPRLCQEVPAYYGSCQGQYGGICPYLMPGNGFCVCQPAISDLNGLARGSGCNT